MVGMSVSPYLSNESVDRMTGAASAGGGGMVALIPTEDDAHRLAIPGWEPVEELHVTLAFLGGVDQPPAFQQRLLDIVAVCAKKTGLVVGDLWAACAFNPTGPTPCATYLVGGSSVEDVHSLLEDRMMGLELPQQHRPWVPHITIGYGLYAWRLGEFGPVTFDRLRVAFEDDTGTDFVLT